MNAILSINQEVLTGHIKSEVSLTGHIKSEASLVGRFTFPTIYNYDIATDDEVNEMIVEVFRN